MSAPVLPPAPTSVYTTPMEVRDYLGTALTDSQIRIAGYYCQDATDLIDRLTRRGGWHAQPITGEIHDLSNVGIRLLLRVRPVASVQAISIRTYVPNDQPRTLIPLTEYELVDPALGLVTLAASYSSEAAYSGYDDYGGSAIATESGTILQGGVSFGSFASVDYTPNNLAPRDIRKAATQLVAHWLAYNSNPNRFEATDLRTADQQIHYETQNGVRVLPAEAMAIILGYRRVLI